MKVIQFGAGNIGRGLIGDILSRYDHEIMFVDINESIVEKLNRLQQYNVSYENHQEHVVKNIKGKCLDRIVESEYIYQCDLITTAVGVGNLKNIAQIVSQIIIKREGNSTDSILRIMPCENDIESARIFKQSLEEIFNKMQRPELINRAKIYKCLVDRIVPFSDQSSLNITTESFYEWIVEGEDFGLSCVKFVDCINFYSDRKLLGLNSSHALLAYLGDLFDKKFIHECILHKDIYDIVAYYIRTVCHCVNLKYGVVWDSEYPEFVLNRFANGLLRDPITRVERDPARKLSRFIQVLNLLKRRSFPYKIVLFAISVLLISKSSYSIMPRDKVHKCGFKQCVRELTDLDDKDIETIEFYYYELKKDL